MEGFEALRTFRRVVELESFAAAARDLGMSTAAVSKQVARLEARLGARLLQRTTRRLALTEAGRLFYARAVRILDDLAEAEAEVAFHTMVPRGVLRVSAPMSLGVRHLAPLLAPFMARYPELRVDLALSDRLVDLIEEGVDVAVRVAALADSSLVARRLCASRSALVAAPAYLARAGEPRAIADLARHECLGYAYRLAGDLWTLEGPEGPVEVRVSGRLRANNGDVLARAAVDGLGIALLPTFIIDGEIRDGRLRVVLPEAPPPAAALHAVYPAGRHLSIKVRAFVDFLVEQLAPVPPWDRPLREGDGSTRLAPPGEAEQRHGEREREPGG